MVTLPRIFWGTERTVECAWKELLFLSARNPAKWSDYLNNLEYVDYQDRPGKIVIFDYTSGRPLQHKDESCWRLYCVQRGWINVVAERGVQPFDVLESQRFVIQGVERLWFALSVLAFDHRCLPFKVEMGRDFYQLVGRAILSKTVYWYPEIEFLANELYYLWNGVDTRFMGDRDGRRALWEKTLYLAMLHLTALQPRRTVSIDEMTSEMERNNWRVLECFEQMGLIEKQGRRHRLKE